MNHLFLKLVFLLVVFPLLVEAKEAKEKALICGVCRNIEHAVAWTISNVEALGLRFEDYRVIIYENNSTDQTATLLADWARENNRITLISENLSPEELPLSRTEKIARARNVVLEVARGKQFANFEYLVMADLDFSTNWPIDALMEVVGSEKEWDCVSANCVKIFSDSKKFYWDRYAFRDQKYPFGPEVLGEFFWKDLGRTWFKLEGTDWIPAYSAFGGLAIYRTKVITSFNYSGVVTHDLERYYQKIIRSLEPFNWHWIQYLLSIDKNLRTDPDESLLVFCPNTPWESPSNYPHITCCEHLPLHASMAVNGFDKFFVNPKMKFSIY